MVSNGLSIIILGVDRNVRTILIFWTIYTKLDHCGTVGLMFDVGNGEVKKSYHTCGMKSRLAKKNQFFWGGGGGGGHKNIT